MDNVKDFLAWYLAPWRRMKRAPFSTALAVASAPGLVMMLLDLGHTGSSLLGGLGGLINPTSSNAATSATQLETLAGQLGAAAVGAPTSMASSGFDWSLLINDACLLALLPAVTMRLRDMGYKGTPNMVLTGILYVSILTDAFQLIGLPFPGNITTPLGILNLLGFGWLCLAASEDSPPPEPKPSFLKPSDPSDWNR